MPSLAREAGDVPHDQEVAGEVELLDHGQLVLELRAHALCHLRPVAPARARVREPAQQRGLRLAAFGGEGGEAVAEVREPEGAALGDGARGGHPGGAVGEARGRLGGAAQRALGVGQQQAPGAVERGVMAETREGVEQLLAGRLRGAHVAGGDDADAERLGLCDGAAGRGLQGAISRTRDREVGAVGAEDAEDVIEPRRKVGPGARFRSRSVDYARLRLAARFACTSERVPTRHLQESGRRVRVRVLRVPPRRRGLRPSARCSGRG